MKGPDQRTLRQLQSAIKAHQLGDFAGARLQYEKVLSRRPRDPDALHFMGVLHHHQGRSAAAIASIQQSLEAAPDNAHAWLNLGNVWLELERSQEAKTAYERSSVIDPNLADAWYNLGICLRKLDDSRSSVGALDRAIGLRPGHAPSYYQRGIALREAGELGRAEVDFRQAIAINGDYTEVYESLGMLLYRQDRIEDAAEVYRVWSERDPGNSTAVHMAAAMSGENVPLRGSNAYVAETFDRFAATFDQNLANLGYRAPQLVALALEQSVGVHRVLDCVLDAGCGTGLCGSLLRPMTRRLVGVDLSSAMIDGARAKGTYDELNVAELTEFMRGYEKVFDAIVSADTFVYFGVLAEAFIAAARALRCGGKFVLSVEEMPDEIPGDYRLEPHGRYCHRLSYVRSALQTAGFRLDNAESHVLRRERGADVVGLVIAATLDDKTPGSSGRTQASHGVGYESASSAMSKVASIAPPFFAPLLSCGW